MASDQTQNVGLKVWRPSDYVQRTEFNFNFNLIDGMLGSLLRKTTNEVSILDYSHLIPNKMLSSDSKNWDISAALQQAINDIQTSKKRTTIKTHGMRFKINSTVTLDISYCNFDGGGSILDAAAVTSGAAMKITGTRLQDGLPALDQYAAYVGNFSLEGNTAVSRGNAGTTGILFDSDTEAGIPGLSVHSINVSYFETGHEYRSRTYTLNFFGCRISKCVNGEFIPRNMTDYGERIAHFGCTLANCTNIIVGQSGGLHYDTCSFDYPTQKYVDLDGTQVSWVNCHIEGRINQWTDPPFLIRPTYGASLIIIGGIFLLSTGTPTHDYLFDIQSAPDKGGGITMRDVRLHNLRTNSKFLAKGTGFLQVDCKLGNENSQMAKFSVENDSANLFADGNFTAANYADLYYVSGDTTTITNPYNSANLKLERSADYGYGTSTTSLKLTKIGATGTTATATIAVPIPLHAKPAIKFRYKKPIGVTGDMNLNAYFAKVADSKDTVGLKWNARRSNTLGTLKKTFTTDAVDWMLEQDLIVTTPHYCAPAWATHLIVTVDLKDMSAGSIYLADFFASTF